MKTIFINNHMQRGACYKNIHIQVRPVYDDLFDSGVFPWACAGRSGSRAQAKQYTETDEYLQADQDPQPDQYPPADQYPQVYVYTDCLGYVDEHTNAHLYPHKPSYRYTNEYTNRHPN